VADDGTGESYDHLLIDGRHLLYRTADAMRDLTTVIDGQVVEVGGIYGFLGSMVKAWKRYGGTVRVAWEGRQARNFRRLLYPEYKKRDEPDADKLAFLESLGKQQAHLQTILSNVGIHQYEGKDCEADDVLGRLATNSEGTVVIFTGDSDLRQLVNDRIFVASPSPMGKDVFFDRAAVIARHHLPPELISDLKALAGDSSDNIPGIRGLGPKTAVELLKRYKSLAGVRAAAKGDDDWGRYKRMKALIKAKPKTLRMYHQLTTIRVDAKMKKIPAARDRKAVMEKLKELNFKSHLRPADIHDLMACGMGEE
jgi:DNA polymerase-1